MDKDNEDFYHLVGFKHNGCSTLLTFSVVGKDGEVLIDDLELTCGVMKTNEDTGAKCRICQSHVVVCDCDYGIGLSSIEDADIPICSPDCPKIRS